jgi:molybdopterin synthase sulfur carrier subunit
MRIRVRGYLTFRKLLGDIHGQEMEIPAMTLLELLEKISRELDPSFKEALFDLQSGEIHGYVRVLVNGKHYSHLPMGLETSLAEGDEISIFPPIAGG